MHLTFVQFTALQFSSVKQEEWGGVYILEHSVPNTAVQVSRVMVEGRGGGSREMVDGLH